MQRYFLKTFFIIFGQLGVITRIRNKFVEVVAVAERYFIIARVKNKGTNKRPF